MSGNIPAILAEALRSGEVTDRESFYKLKMRLCSQYSPHDVPANSEVIALLDASERKRYHTILVKKPVKDASGVAAVAVMTSPYPCPHGKCAYCPGGVTEKSSQSYTGKEPAARRATTYRFDPYDQTLARITQMEDTGHDTSRIDLIIMGGTFTSRLKQYQEWFVKRCFDALNGTVASDLEEAKRINAESEHRVVGLTVETRPDYFTKKSQIDEMMALGATRVELGVQILDDDVLEGVSRGHGVKEVAEATAACLDAGLSVCYHLMPGLPGSSPEHDVECFRRVFDDPAFRPDNLKFYPVLVVGDTELARMWRDGEYTPPDLETAADVLTRMKLIVPPYCRIQRIQRDIPVSEITCGITNSNMRQIVQNRMKEAGLVCRCIRCREAFRTGAEPADPEGEPGDLAYEASGGMEHFISYETGGALIAYLRLRLDGSEIARIREVKVTGTGPDGWQDRGYWEALVRYAEKLASENGAAVMRATCGPGARPIYSDMGYVLEDPYMVRRIH